MSLRNENVLFIDTWSMGNYFTSVGESFKRSLARIGVRLDTVNALAEDFHVQMTQLVNQNQYQFAFSFSGVGKACAAGDKVLWDVLKLPFFTIYGDSPSYFFDQHFDYSIYGTSLYAFEEHLQLREQLSMLRGFHGLAPVLPHDSLIDGEIDWRAKESGKLIFLKNGNDPEKLRQFWRNAFLPEVVDALVEMSDAMTRDFDRCSHRDIVSTVQNLLRRSGFHGGAERLMLIMVAQLDDYLRRVKSTMLTNILLDYPVEVHGLNWDHVDSAGRKGKLIAESDYRKSEYLIRNALATFDMSPNTVTGVHDRVARAAAHRTLCLTNFKPTHETDLPGGANLTYHFNEESIRNRIEWALAHPKDAVELGKAFSDVFQKEHSVERGYAAFKRMAQFVRQNNSTDELADCPPYFVWPPASFVKSPGHKPASVEEVTNLNERVGRVEQTLSQGTTGEANKDGGKKPGLLKRMLSGD